MLWQVLCIPGFIHPLMESAEVQAKTQNSSYTGISLTLGIWSICPTWPDLCKWSGLTSFDIFFHQRLHLIGCFYGWAGHSNSASSTVIKYLSEGHALPVLMFWSVYTINQLTVTLIFKPVLEIRELFVTSIWKNFDPIKPSDRKSLWT